MFPAQAQAEVRIAEMQTKMPIEEVQERFGPHCLSSCPRAFCPYAATQLGRQEAAPRRGLFTFRRCLEEEGGELSSKSINLLRARVERERECACGILAEEDGDGSGSGGGGERKAQNRASPETGGGDRHGRGDRQG